MFTINKIKQNKGYSIAELMVVTLILSAMIAGVFMTLSTGQDSWLTTDTLIQLQENLRITMEKVSKELRETGADKDGAMQVAISDGTGVNNSDVIRFSMPMCVCSTSIIDDNGDVAYWGAPLTWGGITCISSVEDAVVSPTGKVDICHLPPGNPQNSQELSVSVSAVPAHLDHGDWFGACSPCSTDNNKYVEYEINSSNELVRQILDLNSNLVREDIFAQNIVDFQANLSGDQNYVTFTVTAQRDTNLNRTVSSAISMDVYLRNKD